MAGFDQPNTNLWEVLRLLTHQPTISYFRDHFLEEKQELATRGTEMISALPDIKVLTLTDDHEFMVIACDGIW